MIGAYSFVRGVSLFAGHFPNEAVMIGQLANGIPQDIPYQFYIYMSAIVLGTVLGAVFQFRQKKKAEEENFSLQK
jgi:hypothetical protein